MKISKMFFNSFRKLYVLTELVKLGKKHMELLEMREHLNKLIAADHRAR
jgi:hypothetical protein